jgi:hypothetical protein
MISIRSLLGQWAEGFKSHKAYSRLPVGRSLVATCEVSQVSRNWAADTWPHMFHSRDKPLYNGSCHNSSMSAVLILILLVEGSCLNTVDQ